MLTVHDSSYMSYREPTPPWRLLHQIVPYIRHIPRSNQTIISPSVKLVPRVLLLAIIAVQLKFDIWQSLFADLMNNRS